MWENGLMEIINVSIATPNVTRVLRLLIHVLNVQVLGNLDPKIFCKIVDVWKVIMIMEKQIVSPVKLKIVKNVTIKDSV